LTLIKERLSRRRNIRPCLQIGGHDEGQGNLGAASVRALIKVDRNSVSALIAHEIAELRGDFPRVSSCRAKIEALGEGLTQRFSLALDIRLPQCQLLVCGEDRHDALAAVFAAFEQARRRLAGRSALQE
jgi:hypothetical protein